MNAEAVIDDMLATTYERGARGPDKFDCWGMVCEVCKRMGWTVPADPIAHSDDPRALLRIFRDEVKPHQWVRADRQDGAIAFFGRLEAARHAGIVINGGVLHTQMLHGPDWLSPADLSDHKIEYALWAQ